MTTTPPEHYLYCVRAADHPAPGELRGVGDAPVERLERGRLAAWFARLPRLSPSEPALRAHEAVVRAALRTATPVPFRFGTWLASREALEELLTGQEERLLRLLSRVQGRVEMGVRVVEVEGGEAAAGAADARGGGPGRAYLERRRAALGAGREREARAGRMAAELRELLEPPAGETITTLLPDPNTLLELALLVGRGEVAGFRERAAGWHGEGLELALSGPWAPYSFVATERIEA